MSSLQASPAILRLLNQWPWRCRDSKSRRETNVSCPTDEFIRQRVKKRLKNIFVPYFWGLPSVTQGGSVRSTPLPRRSGGESSWPAEAWLLGPAEGQKKYLEMPYKLCFDLYFCVVRVPPPRGSGITEPLEGGAGPPCPPPGGAWSWPNNAPPPALEKKPPSVITVGSKEIFGICWYTTASAVTPHPDADTPSPFRTTFPVAV